MAGDSTGAMIVAAATSASTGGRSNSARRQCGGSSICEHQRQRSKCKACGGGGHVAFVEATEVEEFDGEEDPEVPTVQARVVGGVMPISISSTAAPMTLAEQVQILKSQLGLKGGSMAEVVRQATVQLGVEAGGRPLIEVAASCMQVLGVPEREGRG
tara:strand:- start:571 stop:1041 length:471 start_codon:yes stop_codon:yes gene_type:complete